MSLPISVLTLSRHEGICVQGVSMHLPTLKLSAFLGQCCRVYQSECLTWGLAWNSVHTCVLCDGKVGLDFQVLQ